MTVYDLADRLEQFYQGTHIQVAAKTIREQADKIKELEDILSFYEIKDLQKML